MATSVTFTLLNTRPIHQASDLEAGILALQGYALSCPLIRIDWSLVSGINWAETTLSEFDKVIFISANAVSGFLQKVPISQRNIALPNLPKYYAIGRATQQYGLENGLPLEVLSYRQFDSKALLQASVMQTVQSQKILIVKGLGGQTQLTDILQKRGAMVIDYPVYQRISAPFCRDNWQKFCKASNAILLITSFESFELLYQQLIKMDSKYTNINNQAWSFIKNTIVFSERIKTEIQALGWQPIITVVQKQSVDGVLKILKWL